MLVIKVKFNLNTEVIEVTIPFSIKITEQATNT